VENIAKKKLDSLIKESKIRDCEDPNNFTVTALPSSGKAGLKSDSKKVNMFYCTSLTPRPDCCFVCLSSYIVLLFHNSNACSFKGACLKFGF